MAGKALDLQRLLQQGCQPVRWGGTWCPVPVTPVTQVRLPHPSPHVTHGRLDLLVRDDLCAFDVVDGIGGAGDLQPCEAQP